MVQNSFVSIHAISHYFGQHRILENISFNIADKGIVGLLGQNGAGKSTLMQMISGLLQPSDGQVVVAGYDMLLQSHIAKQHIGFLPEHPPLYLDATVDEYLYFVAKLRGIKRKKLTFAVNSCKEKCNLKSLGKRPIRYLSKGVKQRIGIAQAIIHQPKLIILDEPTTGLDPVQIMQIRKLIMSLGQMHSVILSSHVLSEIEHICERVIIIHHGKLVVDEDLQTLKKGSSKQIQVTCKNPPSLEKLQGIYGLKEARFMSEKQFILTVKSDIDWLSLLLKKGLEEGWGITEFTPIKNNLEQVFLGFLAGRYDTNPVDLKIKKI